MQCPTLKIFQSHHLETKTQKVADWKKIQFTVAGNHFLGLTRVLET